MDSYCNCSRLLNITPIRPGERRFEKHYHVDEQKRIAESAKSCWLCRTISPILTGNNNHELDQQNVNPAPVIRIMMFVSDLTDEAGLFTGFRAGWPRSTKPLSIWADIGTPASKYFVTRPPMYSNNLEEINPLIQTWLRDCEAHHRECRVSSLLEQYDEEEVDLPTRLLLISNDKEATRIRLVETSGKRGRYCALSHCWGPIDKQPLRTTHANLQDHLKDIYLHQLPLTFRQAVLLVQGLGMSYLWIDSLCIVQDDKREWLHESAKMGSLFKNATLMIAAAGSRDSTEGLFITKYPEKPCFRFPYFADDGQAYGSYNVAIDELRLSGDLGGPLRNRAWAFQEWYLSRRKVFFTREGLKWVCRHHDCSERGERVDWGLYETSSWLDLLDIYSGKELTYASDRLIALKGIVNEMRKSRSDDFKYGVWQNDLPQQLLWKFERSSTQRETKPELPGWCWAATEGEKCWVLRFVEEDLQIIATRINLTDSGTLRASAPLLRARVAEHPIQDCCNHALFYKNKSGRINSFELLMLSECRFGDDEDIESFLLLDVNDIDEIHGLAVFDESALLSDVFCLFLGSVARRHDDICNPDSDEKRSIVGDINEVKCDKDENSADEDEIVSSDDEHGDHHGHDIEDDAAHRDVDAGHEATDEESSCHASSFTGAPNEDQVSDAGDRGWEIDWGSSSPFNHELTDVCVDFTSQGVWRYKTVYWALLLQPVDKTLKRFKRVGIGLLYPQTYDKAKDEISEVEVL